MLLTEIAASISGTPGVGGVAQTFDTVPGQNYHVSFDLAGHNSGLLQTMRVSAAGKSAEFSFQSGTDPNNLGWQGKTWDFTATAPQAILKFESLQTGYEYGGPALDNVAVTLAGMVTPGGFDGGNLRLTVAGPTVDTPAFSSEAKVTGNSVEFPLLPEVTGQIGTVVPVQIDLLDNKIDSIFRRPVAANTLQCLAASTDTFLTTSTTVCRRSLAWTSLKTIRRWL